MTKEQLIAYKEKLAKLSNYEKKQRDIYLAKLANGEIQGPPVGYASIDKPWLKYYDEAHLNADFINKTCYQLLVQNSKTRLDNIAMEYFGRKITFKKLLEEIEKTAKSFKKLGVKKGDIVTFLAVNAPEVVYSFYALNKLGAIPNMVDPRSNVTALENYLNEVNSKYLVSLDLCYPNVEKAIEKTKVEKVIILSPTDSIPYGLKLAATIPNKIKQIIGKGMNIKETDVYIKWNSFIEHGKEEKTFPSVPYVKDYPAVIVHTGGTTGVPKGVLLSNDNFNAVVHQVQYSPIGMQENDKFLNILVPFVAYGLALGLHTPMTLGWDSILIPKFSPKDIVGLMTKHKPAGVMGIETYYEPLLSTDKYDYSYSKAILMGGMPTKEQFEKNMNEKIRANNGHFQISKGYSMTEASSCATCSFNHANKAGSNGIPLKNTIIAAFDPTTSEELGYNQSGEICILTPTRMIEYYNNNDATKQVLKQHSDGNVWIHSGDIGYVTEDGFVFIIDRIKRMIIRSGFKVFPSEIENVILKHPAVETCAVIGVDDKIDDKAPKAFVVLKSEFQNLEDSIRQELEKSIEANGLPSYFAPVEYVFRNNLPLTNIGKIDFVKLESEESDKVKSIGRRD